MFSLLLTLLGVIGFIISAKELIHVSGLLLLSILFMIIPATLIALNWDTCHLTKIQSLSLVIIPLIFLNYIYHIVMVLPVGFSDVHFHILQCLRLVNVDGVIQFSERLSFNFVSLYLVFYFLMAASNLDISTLASLIPPIFNLILIFTVYLLVNKLHSHEIALIAMMLYGWENQVLLFGHEMRTQTLGVLLLFIALVFEFSNFKKLIPNTILIIILFSSVMTSFVSVFSTYIIFLVMLVTSIILYFVLKWPENVSRITWRFLGLYTITFMSYIMYISGGFEYIIDSIVILYNQMTANVEATEFSGSQLVQSTGQTMYGDFVKISTYVFWSLFLLFSIFYAAMIINKKKSANLKFFVSFSILLFYTFFNTFFEGVLSAGRLYTIAFTVIATVIAFGLFKLQDITKKTQFKYTGKILAISLILVFVISSTVKLPNYIIGETNPIRSEALIDSVSYWDSDIPQYSVGEFLSSYAPNQSLIIYTFVENYILLQQRMKNSIGQGKLSILHDKFHGECYTYRDQLPESQMFEGLDKIYSNTDYIIFKERVEKSY